MFMSKMETFIVLIWSSRHRMPHSLTASHSFIFVKPKSKSKSLSKQTPKSNQVQDQHYYFTSNALAHSCQTQWQQLG